MYSDFSVLRKVLKIRENQTTELSVQQFLYGDEVENDTIYLDPAFLGK